MTVSETLRAALLDCGRPQREIADEAGVHYSVVCRFLAGDGLRSGNLDALCEWAGLRLTPTRTATKRRGGQ